MSAAKPIGAATRNRWVSLALNPSYVERDEAEQVTTAMSWIVEHTPERLVVRLGAPFPHSATCVFDKTTGRARFERRLFFIPRPAIEVALGEVAEFEVMEVGPPLNSFDPRVTLRSGKRFYLSPAATKAETRAVARAVRGFLGLAHG